MLGLGSVWLGHSKLSVCLQAGVWLLLVLTGDLCTRATILKLEICQESLPVERSASMVKATRVDYKHRPSGACKLSGGCAYHLCTGPCCRRATHVIPLVAGCPLWSSSLHHNT